MITPHKYLNLDLSLLSLGGLVLKLLQEFNSLKYDELLEKLVLSRGDSVKDVFTLTLSFLYLLNKIEYNKELDTIEIIK